MASMLKLRGVNFGTTNLAEIAVGVELPPHVRLFDASVDLVITVNPGDDTSVSKAISLRRSQVLDDYSSLKKVAMPDSIVSAFRISEGDIASVEEFRKEILLHRAKATSVPRLLISVRADGCLANGSLKDGSKKKLQPGFEDLAQRSLGGVHQSKPEAIREEALSAELNYQDAAKFNSYLKTSETKEFVLLHYRAPLMSVSSDTADARFVDESCEVF